MLINSSPRKRTTKSLEIPTIEQPVTRNIIRAKVSKVFCVWQSRQKRRQKNKPIPNEKCFCESSKKYESKKPRELIKAHGVFFLTKGPKRSIKLASAKSTISGIMY
jgi:hypothetical protein